MLKISIIRKLRSGKYKLYSKKKDKSGKRKNLGVFTSLEQAKKREKEVQYFKHHSDDGMADDKETKVLSKLSDIATYLEEAGFTDRADKVYTIMNNIDGEMDSDVIDSDYYTPTEHGFRGTFDPGAAQCLATLANEFDKIGLYDCADAIDNILVANILSTGTNKLDNMLEIIEKLDCVLKEKKLNKVEPDEKPMEGVDAISRSNGLMGNSFTDSQNIGMFGDMYFNNSYQNQEGACGPAYG